ncbi:MAG: hypothetical protein H7Y33_04370, partial [Cytophagales bacterium]|nr:hypothetical protein [Rhizobacter sp.]
MSCIVSTFWAVHATRQALALAEKQKQTSAALREARAQRLQSEQLAAGLQLEQSLNQCQQG